MIRIGVHRIAKALQAHPFFIKKRGFTLSVESNSSFSTALQNFPRAS